MERVNPFVSDIRKVFLFTVLRSEKTVLLSLHGERSEIESFELREVLSRMTGPVALSGESVCLTSKTIKTFIGSHPYVELHPVASCATGVHIYCAMAGEKNEQFQLNRKFTLLLVEMAAKRLLDITRMDLIRQQQEVIELERARSISAAQLASLGEMASGIAHEVNNPLAVIALSAEQLKRELTKQTPSIQAQTKLLAIIEATVDRISQIVKGMRSIGRDSSLEEAGAWKVRSIIDDVLSVSREKFKVNDVLLQVTGEDLFDEVVVCRRVQLSQAFLNLLNNAFDAVGDSSIETKWVKVDVSFTSDNFCLSVTDSGGGVPEELREKIFLPFFTTKDIGKGTGLGLSISQRLMKKDGGDIVLVSGQGPTCFKILYPRRSKA